MYKNQKLIGFHIALGNYQLEIDKTIKAIHIMIHFDLITFRLLNQLLITTHVVFDGY